MPKQQVFTTRLEPVEKGSAWVLLHVPFDVQRVFDTRGRVSVRGTINGFEFRSSIFPGMRGESRHHLMVNKAMQAGAKARPGDTVKVTMMLDDTPREVELPDDFADAIRRNAKARAAFETLTPAGRGSFADWVQSAKKDETRARRIEVAVVEIASGKRRHD